MLTGVARRNCAAASNQWKSGRLRIMSRTRWPGCTPCACRPAAARATRSAYSEAVHSSHAPGVSPRMARSITRSGWASTVSRKRDGAVWPATVAWISSAGTQTGLVVVIVATPTCARTHHSGRWVRLARGDPGRQT